MTSIRIQIQRAVDFVQKDIWRVRLAALPPVKAFPLTVLRTLVLSLRGFNQHRCQLRASALTFYSLMSVVPVAAMAFGVAKGFGFERRLEEALRTKLAGQEELLEKIITFSHSMLASTKGGLLAGVGLIVLFWTAISLLGQIETSLNDIWEVKRKRTLGRTFSDYLSLMIICPVLMILSSSATVFITTQITMIVEKISLLGALGPLILMTLKLLPYCVIWGLFTFVYMFIPNTRVRFFSALVAGITAGTIFQVVQWVYINFQVDTVKYNAIYGSFAVLPLFLGWLQLSWMIVLFGAELSCAHQRADHAEFEPDARQASHHLRLLLALQITRRLVQRFAEGEPPLTVRALSQQLDIPIGLVDEILPVLIENRIVSAVEAAAGGERGFQPARDINGLTIQSVVEALEKSGENVPPFGLTPEFQALAEAVETFRQSVASLPANRLLRDI